MVDSRWAMMMVVRPCLAYNENYLKCYNYFLNKEDNKSDQHSSSKLCDDKYLNLVPAF